MRRSTVISLLCVLALAAGCGEADKADRLAGADKAERPAGADKPNRPVSVWNQAYQENFEEDKVSDIVASARNSYVLLDAFESVEARRAIPQIKKNGNIVSIYMSIGTGEKWRDDFGQIRSSLVARQWKDWEGEYFVDRITEELVDAMKGRIDRAAGWGADMVEFDNMDWAFDEDYRREYGFRVTAGQGIAYYNGLCEYALSRGVKCMAKNTTKDANRFAGVTFESDHDDKEWWEPRQLRDFLARGKLGIIVHYNERDPDKVLAFYRKRYGDDLLFIAESTVKKRYVRPTASHTGRP